MPKENLDKTITIRITSQMLERIEAEAKDQGMSKSEYGLNLLKKALGISEEYTTATHNVDNLNALIEAIVSSRLTQLEEDFNSSLRSVEDTLSREIDSLKKQPKPPIRPETIAAITALNTKRV
jgi:predicted DNA-binding protein